MPPRKQKPTATRQAVTTAEDEDLDAMLDAAIRENQAVAGSPAALRLEQEQREARERAEAEAQAVQYVCEGCGAGRASKKCSGCATVRYCGEQCQAAHWPAHKARCRVLKAEAAVAAAEAEVEAHRRGEGQEEEEVVHNPDTEAGNCWNCGADNPRNVCDRCKVTKYCGVACQTENWSIHKGRCAGLKGDYAAFDKLKSELKKIKAGARLSQKELNRDLKDASLLGRVADIERLVAAGGNVNAPVGEYSPLHAAAQEGHACAIGVLVRHGAQVDARDEKGFAAIHSASECGQLKAVAALLEHGAQIDSRSIGGFNPLFNASQNNHPEVVALLLQKGAQVDLSTKTGATALIVSSQNGHVAVVRLLLQHGAQIDLRNNVGAGPLYFASQNNQPEVVALLLEHGAQVDLPNIHGASPLVVAAIQGNVAVAKLLLQAGADPLRSGAGGYTAVDLAASRHHTEVVALLQARIAEMARARA